MSKTKACELCGEPFSCGANDPNGDCWCKDMPPLQEIPKEFRDCLCAKCLRLFIKDKKQDLVIEKK